MVPQLVEALKNKVLELLLLLLRVQTWAACTNCQRALTWPPYYALASYAPATPCPVLSYAAGGGERANGPQPHAMFDGRGQVFRVGVQYFRAARPPGELRYLPTRSLRGARYSHGVSVCTRE